MLQTPEQKRNSNQEHNKVQQQSAELHGCRKPWQRANSLWWEPMSQPSKQREGLTPSSRAVGEMEEIHVAFCGPNIQGAFNTVLAYIQCHGTQLRLDSRERLCVWPPLLQLGARSKQAERTCQQLQRMPGICLELLAPCFSRDSHVPSWWKSFQFYFPDHPVSPLIISL